jgi:hypothetical protein
VIRERDRALGERGGGEMGGRDGGKGGDKREIARYLAVKRQKRGWFEREIARCRTPQSGVEYSRPATAVN